MKYNNQIFLDEFKNKMLEKSSKGAFCLLE